MEERPKLAARYDRTRHERVSTVLTQALFEEMAKHGGEAYTFGQMEESRDAMRWSGTWENLHYLVANALESTRITVTELGVVTHALTDKEPPVTPEADGGS